MGVKVKLDDKFLSSQKAKAFTHRLKIIKSKIEYWKERLEAAANESDVIYILTDSINIEGWKERLEAAANESDVIYILADSIYENKVWISCDDWLGTNRKKSKKKSNRKRRRR